MMTEVYPGYRYYIHRKKQFSSAVPKEITVPRNYTRYSLCSLEKQAIFYFSFLIDKSCQTISSISRRLIQKKKSCKIQEYDYNVCASPFYISTLLHFFPLPFFLYISHEILLVINNQQLSCLIITHKQ